MTFGSLLDLAESFEEPDAEEHNAFADKAATWKIALYWATNRRFWSCSREITEGIKTNEHTRDPDVREAVRWCPLDSVKHASETPIKDILGRRQWDDLHDLEAAIERGIREVERPEVRSTLPEESIYRAVIDYVGAYAVWNLFSGSTGSQPYDLEIVENLSQDDDKQRMINREDPAPYT